MTTIEDPARGLTFQLNRQACMSEFCTRIVQRTDNLSTNRPKNTPFANMLTQSIINAGGLSSIKTSRESSVITVYQSDIHHAYPKWRHLSQVNRTHYYQRALSKKAIEIKSKPMAFTMRLSPELAKVVIKNNGAGYLLERLMLRLKRSLRRMPEVWLVLEATTRERDQNGRGRPKTKVSWSHGLLHVHGAIGLHEDEMVEMKRTIRELNGSSNKTFLNNEISLVKIEDDTTWVEYCHKHSFLNDCFLAGLQRYSRSNALSAEAEQMYESDRAMFKSAIK